MPGPISTERMIAARGIRAAMWVSSGPGPLLPFSPSLWQARQPEPATTSLPGSYLAAHLHVDLGRRAAGGAEVGEVAHRDDRDDAGGGRDRAALGPALGAAVVERQQQQQDHADRRDADRRDRDQLRRLDHAQELEEEEEVPLGARHVGGRGRVRLRALLGAEDDRHRDDHGDDDQRHHRVLHHRVGEERLPLLLQKLVLLEVCLLVLRLHAGDAHSPSPSTGTPSTRWPIDAAVAVGAGVERGGRGGDLRPLGFDPGRRRGAELDDQVHVGADQGDDRPGHEQHVDRVEAREGRRPELRPGAEEVAQVGADDRAGAVDVDADDRGPEGALVEGQQVAGEGHRHRQDQQHDADHPVELARVLVGAEEEGPAHVEEDQDHHHARAPLVHPVHELAERDLVVDVGDRGVGLGRRGRVEHRQEDAGDGLDDEGEEGRRAERVEPVGPLRHLAEEHAGEEAAGGEPLVDPAEGVDRRLFAAVEQLVAVARALRRRGLQVGRAPGPCGVPPLPGLAGLRSGGGTTASGILGFGKLGIRAPGR